MRIYKWGEKEQDTIVMVQPGREFPEIAAWMTEERNDKGVMEKRATVINVKFVDGKADVTHELGRYMLDRGLAERERRPDGHRTIESPVQFNDVTTKQIIELPREITQSAS